MVSKASRRELLGCLVALLHAGGCSVDTTPAPPPNARPLRPASLDETRPPRPLGFLGVVLSEKSVDVASRFESRLDEVTAQVGQQLQAGDVIAIVDMRAVHADLAIAEATVASARAARQNAAVELAQATQKLSRRSRLSRELISAEELATARFDKAQASARLSSATADLAEKRAHVTQQRAALDDATIRAPFAGAVAARYLDPGSAVHPGTPIVKLISGGVPEVRFAIPEDEREHVRVDGRIDVTIPSLRTALHGTVENVAPQVDSASNFVFVTARLEIPAEQRSRISHGLMARVTLPSSADVREARR